MESVYRYTHTVSSLECDCFLRLRPGAMLSLLQDAASAHCSQLHFSREDPAMQGLIWAITRHHISINRLPLFGETITIETWPGKTSRVAYPRNSICYDGEGKELFRSVSLWVLMDANTRTLVLPGKSGIELPGHTRAGELPAPGSMAPLHLQAQTHRPVVFTELDSNGHMNNSHCADWLMDLLPVSFHRDHPVKDLTISYLAEAREGDQLDLSYQLNPQGVFHLDAQHQQSGHRIFSLEARFL